jgi:hypothetical protein
LGHPVYKLLAYIWWYVNQALKTRAQYFISQCQVIMGAFRSHGKIGLTKEYYKILPCHGLDFHVLFQNDLYLVWAYHFYNIFIHSSCLRLLYVKIEIDFNVSFYSITWMNVCISTGSLFMKWNTEGFKHLRAYTYTYTCKNA